VNTQAPQQYPTTGMNNGLQKQVYLVQEEPRDASQLVEIPVTANGLTRVPIPDQQQLRSLVDRTVVIKGIRLISTDVLTNAPLTGGINAPTTELVKISLVLYSMGWERGQLIPLLLLNDISGGAAGATPFRFHPTKFNNWRNVDWTKSYLQFSNGQFSAGSPYTVLFDVEYLKIDASGKPIEGAD
jgi:hypothetical protein